MDVVFLFGLVITLMLAISALTMGMFLWGRWRHDLVALAALMALPRALLAAWPEKAFASSGDSEAMTELFGGFSDRPLFVSEILGGEDVLGIVFPEQEFAAGGITLVRHVRSPLRDRGQAAAGHIASNIPAAPMPVPMHIVTIA